MGRRAFTLVELLVSLGIVAAISLAVVLIASRPGSLREATAGFDSQLAAAQALAATSGDGATLVFLPHRDRAAHPLPGFSLLVFSGRPNSHGAVLPANVVSFDGDADVREATLGAPPFAMFLSTAGHPSGAASYPRLDANGRLAFTPIAVQPPCPSGGFTLTFADRIATQTRTLACGAVARGTPIPIATMSPSPIVLTPSLLVFDFPAAARQRFVATEWGYARWFAADDWNCGSGIAAFPHDSPAVPYTPPYAPQYADQPPLPPVQRPYSFANSAQSLEDAPATFFLNPRADGICESTITDAFGQGAGLAVRVMGQLAASPSDLQWNTAMQTQSQTTRLGKSYDASPLTARVVTSSCSNVISATWGSRTTPAQPGPVPASQALYVRPLTDAAGRNRGGTCAISFASQFAGEPLAQLRIGVRGSLVSWPAGVRYAQGGQRLDASACRAGQAQAFVTPWTVADANDARYASLGIHTDANGCYSGALVAFEPDGSKQRFSVASDSCGSALTLRSWLPQATGVQAALQASGGERSASSCAVVLSDASGTPPAFGYGIVAVAVVPSQSSSCSEGARLAVGSSCAFAVPDGTDTSICDPGAGAVGGVTTTYAALLADGSTAGTLRGTPPQYTVTRVLPGPITVEQLESQSTFYWASGPNGPFCQMHTTLIRSTLFTLH